MDPPSAGCETGRMTLHITGDEAADRLLTDNPLALLIGMLLDQQVAMETAFAGPLKIQERIGSVDAATIAGYDPEAFVEVFRTTPAVHRFPGSMAARVQALCAAVEQEWGGDAAAIWRRPGPGEGTSGEPSGAEVLRRLKGLPGFGEQKAKIFLALLGKQNGFDGDGWREASGTYGEADSYRSVADITSADSLAKVREHKRAMKAAAKRRDGTHRRGCPGIHRGGDTREEATGCRDPGRPDGARHRRGAGAVGVDHRLRAVPLSV